MKKKNILNIIYLLTITLYISSCIKDPVDNPDPNPVSNSEKKLYVLNEGLFNLNNSSLSYYNYKDSIVENEYFYTVNKRKLGDTGNDMKKYGGKLYCVINVSSQIEVLDIKNGKSLKQIPLFDGSVGRQPRMICFDKNRAFVSCFDGTIAVIDTNSLTVTKYINVGPNPEGVAILGNKLYVANSGGLNFPNYNNTVSIVDLNTLEEEKTIEVPINPYLLMTDKYGDLYLTTRGNYSDIRPQLHIINTSTNEIKYTFPDIEILNMVIKNDTAYAYNYDYDTEKGEIIVLNINSESVINKGFISDGTKINTIYGIEYDPYSSDIYISDANKFINTGSVYCFDKSGKHKFNFRAGLNPSKMVFVKN